MEINEKDDMKNMLAIDVSKGIEVCLSFQEMNLNDKLLQGILYHGGIM